MVSADATAYTAFLLKFGYTPNTSSDAVLALSFAFMSTLPFCSGVADFVAVEDDDGALSVDPNAAVLKQAQCFIAYAMSADGGGFNPTEIAEVKTTTKEGLGRSALVDEYEINQALVGTDPMSLLQRIPMAYGLLKSLLCPEENGAICNFDVIR